MQLMDDHLLMGVLDSFHCAVFIMDLDLELTFCNRKAVNLFGIKKVDLIGLVNPLSLTQEMLSNSYDSIDKKHFDTIRIKFDKQDKAYNVRGYLTKITDSSNNHTGYCMLIRRKVMPKEESLSTYKRTFESIRLLILSTLLTKRKTINQVAKDINVNWKTVENHLTYLIGKKKISEIFSSSYVRIFEITDLGKEFLISNVPHKDVILKNHKANDKTKTTIGAEDLELSMEVER